MTSVAVVGAGGIGTVLAAAIADAGHEVVVCARSTPGPLILERGGTSTKLDVRVLTEPDGLSNVDWVLLCTKAHDTPAAAAWLERSCAAGTTVVVCQNGIGHADRIAGLTGPAQVLPALVYIAAERVAPGRVRHHRGAQLVVPAGDAAGRTGPGPRHHCRAGFPDRVVAQAADQRGRQRGDGADGAADGRTR